MKMNRTNTAGRILALLLTALMVLSLAACATKGGDKMDGMSSEPKNAEEAVAMHKELMAHFLLQLDGFLGKGYTLCQIGSLVDTTLNLGAKLQKNPEMFA